MKRSVLIALFVVCSLSQNAFAAVPKNNNRKTPTKLAKPIPKTHGTEPVHHAAEPKPGKLVKREPEKPAPKKPATVKEHISETLKSHSKTGKAPSSEDAENLSKIADQVKTKDKEIADTQAAHAAATSETEKKEIKKNLDEAKKHRKTYWGMFETEVKRVADDIGADARAAWDDIKKHF